LDLIEIFQKQVNKIDAVDTGYANFLEENIVYTLTALYTALVHFKRLPCA